MSRRQIHPYEFRNIILNDSLEEIKRMIDSSNVNMENFLDSPLNIAIEAKRKDVIDYLISQGAVIGDWSFYLAIKNKMLDVLQNLLEARGYLLPDEHHYLMLTAAHEGNFEIIDFLTKKEVLFKIKSKDDGTTMLLNAIQKKKYDLARYLIENGSNVTSRTLDGVAPLMVASNGDLGFFQYLVEKGANIDVQTKFGVTPLIIAADTENEPIVKFLISKNANPFTQWDKHTARKITGDEKIKEMLRVHEINYRAQQLRDKIQGYFSAIPYDLVVYYISENLDGFNLMNK